jgi:glycosyltransferase involved in cell wall biosynthesis
MTYPAGIRSAKKSAKPFVAHVHATEFDRTGGSVDQRIAELEYQGLTAADHVIAVSNYTKDTIVNKYAISKDKISVVHNGVDVMDFEPLNIKKIFPNHQIVLYVGRLTFQKGVEYFLQAASRVSQAHPNTIFLVVGDGDMYQKHVLEAASLGIGNKVIFTGFLQGDQLKTTYQMADAFVMPSVSEPYGIVALEAIASGVPTVISKQSGVSETLGNVYKADFWDIEALSQHINSILTYPTQARLVSELAKSEVRQLTWNQAAQKTLSIYKQVLA